MSFVKYDSRSASLTDISASSDDERFEIGQQYAWEWSLTINAISEEDSGIYSCRVGASVIKQFELIVKVPPRIRDDSLLIAPAKHVREGTSVQLGCFASGTPRPNISWYVIDERTQHIVKLGDEMQTGSGGGNYLELRNVTRHTPRRYQCRASNNIPPSDTRNLTFHVECKLFKSFIVFDPQQLK